MIPVFVLTVSFIAFRIAGLAVPYFAHWQLSLRAALGVMFLLTASAHWGKRRADLIRMVPRTLGNAPLWVTLTGVAELLIALGLQIPFIALPTAAFAAAMLICIFPANVKAAREHLSIAGRPVPALLPRLAIQAVFLTALTASVWPK